MEFLKGRRKCWATLMSVTQRKGKAYPDDDWRMELVGRRGWFEFTNRSFPMDAYHTVRFSDCEREEERTWSFETSEMIDIKEDEEGVVFVSKDSIYRFELEAEAKDITCDTFMHPEFSMLVPGMGSSNEEGKMETIIRAEVRRILENEHFREVYFNSPSDNCREYYRHEFAGELYSDEEYLKIRAEIEKTLSKEDYEYLERNTGNNPRKIYFRNKAKEKE